jgi:hypothetical protein
MTTKSDAPGRHSRGTTVRMDSDPLTVTRKVPFPRHANAKERLSPHPHARLERTLNYGT